MPSSIIGVGAGAGAVAIMKRGEIDAMSNLDPVISLLEGDGNFVPVIDTRTAKGMKDVYGGAYAAGCIYVTDRVREEEPEHGAGGRQRDGARAALHRRSVDARPDRRGRAARVLQPTRRSTRRRSRRTSTASSTTASIVHRRPRENVYTRSASSSIRRCRRRADRSREDLDMSFQQKARAKYK